MRLLLDTNIVLDALLGRIPWNREAEAILQANRAGNLAAHITASSLTDIFYVAKKLTNRAKAWQVVGACLDQLYVLPVGRAELIAATSNSDGDLEDELQLACARLAKLDAIVTRDSKGFPDSPVAILTPAELLSRLPT